MASTRINWSDKQKSGWSSPLKVSWIKEGKVLERNLAKVTNEKTKNTPRQQSFRYRSGKGWKTFTYRKKIPPRGRMAAGWSVVLNRKGDGFTVMNTQEYAKAADLGHKHVPIKFKSPAYFKGKNQRLVVMSELKKSYSVKGLGIVKEALRRSVLSTRKPFKATWTTKGQIARRNR